MIDLSSDFPVVPGGRRLIPPPKLSTNLTRRSSFDNFQSTIWQLYPATAVYITAGRLLIIVNVSLTVSLLLLPLVNGLYSVFLVFQPLKV